MILRDLPGLTCELVFRRELFHGLDRRLAGVALQAVQAQAGQQVVEPEGGNVVGLPSVRASVFNKRRAGGRADRCRRIRTNKGGRFPVGRRLL